MTEIVRGDLPPSIVRTPAELADLWGRQSDAAARTAPSVGLPPLAVGLRQVEPDRVSYDLCVETGRWVDTGLPWAADGRHDRLVLFPAAITDGAGRIVIVTLWSYDLCPVAGYYQDTGGIWPAISTTSADAWPQMVVETTADRVTIYSKAGADGLPTYVRHPVEHYVNAARNTDVWRSDEPSEATRQADGSFAVGQRILQDSEVDTAIQLTGRVDFAGGRFHGNEELQRPAIWMVDGVPVDPAAGLTYEPRRVELVQCVRLHDPGTVEATQYSPRGAPFLELTKVHTWERGEYRIRTHVKELYTDGAASIRYGFFLMCPVLRLDGSEQITHTAARAPYWQTEDVSLPDFGKSETTADRVIVWGDRYSVEWRAIDGWLDPSRRVYVDNRPSYNKIYPGFFRDGAHDLLGLEYDVEAAIRIAIKESA
ncbi:hypothetical protein ACRC7T_13830 [Segnochrobactraceae bacterium EtOH-i3]